MDPHSSSLQVAYANHSSAYQPMLNETSPVQVRLEALDEKWQIFLVSLYSMTAITSFVLNVITVIVLARYRHSELRKYLMNLSVSDLLMSLLSIPFTYTEYMLGRWIFASFLCPLVRFAVTLSVFVSVATMTVIGINRHSAVMYPLRKRVCLRCCCFRNQSVTIKKSNVIAAIWLVGIAISAPEYLMHQVVPFEYNGQCYVECTSQWPVSISDLYTVFIFSSTFVVPLLILTILYAKIGLKLWRREVPGEVDINRDLTMQTTRVKVIKMLFVLVIVFAVFWLPLQTFSMVTFLYPNTRKGIIYESASYNLFVGAYFTFHWLSMFHSCLNPLIYCFMNDKFRSDLYDLLCNRANKGNPNDLLQDSRQNRGSLVPHFTKWILAINTSTTGQSSRLDHGNGMANSRRSSNNHAPAGGAKFVCVHSFAPANGGTGSRAAATSSADTRVALGSPLEAEVAVMEQQQLDDTTPRVLTAADSTESDQQMTSTTTLTTTTGSQVKAFKVLIVEDLSAGPDYVRIVSVPAQTNNRHPVFQDDDDQRSVFIRGRSQDDQDNNQIERQQLDEDCSDEDTDRY